MIDLGAHNGHPDIYIRVYGLVTGSPSGIGVSVELDCLAGNGEA